MPIHLRDMANLKNKHPDVYQEFQAGHFVGQKTRRKFSMMPLDQIHEQLNDWLKNESGTIGNLDDPATVRREQVSRPEMARLIQEVEGSKDQSTRHHEQYPQYQKKFKEDVLNLIQAFEDLGNPFLEESADLLDLDQSIMMPDDVINNVRKISSFGRELYNKFLNERVFDQKVPFNETLKEVNLRLFKDVLKSKSKSTKATISALKDEHSKASHLLLAAQGGRPISDDLFGHESSKFPPALTKDGVIYHSTKSEMLDCLCVQEKQVAPDTTCALLDGAVVVQMLRPKNSTTFGDYCADVFLQYVLTMLKTKDRVDIVFDVYKDNSLKSGIRQQRGTGIRRRVTLSTKIPGNWASFLRVSQNKQELFIEISQYMKTVTLPAGKRIVCTLLEECLVVPEGSLNLSSLAPCSHEEADTRILLHLANAVACTTVVVLAVRATQILKDQTPSLLAFHALSGCDTVSSFFGKGKRSAWQAWQACPDLTSALLELSSPVSHDSVKRVLPIIETFVTRLYGVESVDLVNAARKTLFLNKGKQFVQIPPSSDALQLHLLRAVHQSAFVWGGLLIRDPLVPSPEEWGWQRSGSAFVPHYISLPPLSSSLPELSFCSCKSVCKRPCKCIVNEQVCISLCFCRGQCNKE
ncbi:hypothetical protein CAPTEDRAFT_223408 [Capitella teleta]|uniref:Tesmin/TSO1-like CXC domain-containing protein n=1 Tax=Capitella teleta TaxID=283909 RepID=R7TCI5_CAPTE|nr:hypothetical protein CAPTEDRAFT_223408 [Capitella teleta]|eukprot:ELT89202.1 hypothetical protein CAPTEDRAFT_223408 [Capitella teleta]